MAQLYRFAFRWSIPERMREIPAAIKAFSKEGKEWIPFLMKGIAERFIFQNWNYHFQGCTSDPRKYPGKVVQPVRSLCGGSDNGKRGDPEQVLHEARHASTGTLDGRYWTSHGC